jgi:sterol O-acyltransferase
MLSGSLIGMQMKMLLFYGFLHCWLNAFAEMMRFGDRQFYSDWWNANSYGTFYRKWNVVVHEWLHAYIFTFSLKVFNRFISF